MTFEDSQDDLHKTHSEVLDIWNDMAFVICSKNTNDINDLMHKVTHFKRRVTTAP